MLSSFSFVLKEDMDIKVSKSVVYHYTEFCQLIQGIYYINFVKQNMSTNYPLMMFLHTCVKHGCFEYQKQKF